MLKLETLAKRGPEKVVSERTHACGDGAQW